MRGVLVGAANRACAGYIEREEGETRKKERGAE
jgi:hypothetical protein